MSDKVEIIDIPANIKRNQLGFETSANYGKILFEEKKSYPVLEIQTDKCPDIILTQYFLHLKFNSDSYLEEIEGYQSERARKLSDSTLFPEDVNKTYDDKIVACEKRMKKAIESNPDVSFLVGVMKYEEAYPVHKWKFVVSKEVAIIMIDRKWQLGNYDATFEVPSGQKSTSISLSTK